MFSFSFSNSRMAFVWFLALFVLSHLFLQQNSTACPESFPCGSVGPMTFPFNLQPLPCGLCWVRCDQSQFPVIPGERGRQDLTVTKLITHDTIVVHNPILEEQIRHRRCDIFNNMSLPVCPFVSVTLQPPFLKLYKCHESNDLQRNWRTHEFFLGHKDHTTCPGFSIYYTYPVHHSWTPSPPPNCAIVQLPSRMSADEVTNDEDLFAVLTADFVLEFHVNETCSKCHFAKGGQCRRSNYTDDNSFYCDEGKEENGTTENGTAENGKLKVILLATVIPGVLIICLVIIGTYLRKQGKPSFYFRSRNSSSDPSSKPGLEGSSVFFGVPVFSYNELEEATDNFHSSKELGDGGFGTVYYGKLQDGREVAVKRLYEHNYKRVEQFMNEIEILTRLRHRNLLTLYGCTSRHCRELLLVYEYIPNGTVADHLHGDKANEGPLIWPIRMKIAIESASALAYLHASDIIHRDVKTNNILLDNNFCVKVADFGLSKLFPNDVSHVSTAPQGTAGYVDPEYYQCYQLTDKSDVYSFGVVLVELISSLPAVDISRHRHEINLANLAINRIQRCEFSELIDSNLGFEIDAAVNRMTTSVAELAFRCLQHEKEMRPSMDEVLEALQEIQNYESELEQTGQADGSVGISRRATKRPFSPESDNAVLLKNNKLPPSPNSVADNSWVSSSTATSGSG